MGKSFKRNDEDYDEVQLRESRKEAKARKRKDYEMSEFASYEDRRK